MKKELCWFRAFDPRSKERWPALWPALKGSLVQVRKPCIRPNCPACARGEKHPAWILSVSRQGRRACYYVPAALVPTLRQALRNGRAVEKLLHRTGPKIIQAFRRQRDRQATHAPAKPKS